jgi:S1-C subfamily serine protease
MRPALAALGAATLAVGLALAGWAALGADSDQPEVRAPSTRAVSIWVASGPASREVGTGFTAGRGRVITVAHLVEGRRRVRVRAGGGARPLAGRVVSVDHRTDLALVSVPGLRAPALRSAPASAASAGESVRVLVRRDARTVTLAARVRRLITASLRPAGGPPRRRGGIELAAPIAAGDSGAAVVAGGGEVVGVVFARSRNHPRTAYAVGAAALVRLATAELPTIERRVIGRRAQ